MWELWWTLEALIDGVFQGWMNCWVIVGIESISLVVFTQIVHYPANKMLRIVLIAGNGLDQFFDVAEAAIEKFAIDNGCVLLEAHGRPGWTRRIPGVTDHGHVITRRVSTLKVQ